jgi:hypothetical protein
VDDEPALHSAKRRKLTTSETRYPISISFNWKVLISRFFAEEAYIRRREVGLDFMYEVKDKIRKLVADTSTQLSASTSSLGSALSNERSLLQPLDAVVLAAYKHEYIKYGLRIQDFISGSDTKHHRPHIHDLAYDNRLRSSYEEAGLSLI